MRYQVHAKYVLPRYLLALFPSETNYEFPEHIVLTIFSEFYVIQLRPQLAPNLSI